MSSRISLSAYKKKREALAVAPSSADRRLGFGASVREAAQVPNSENRSLDRLEGLLKRCDRNSACAQAKSEWLCSEGPKGHGKKGLSLLLCYVKVWSGVLRAEETLLEGDRNMDSAESRARSAFGACTCALRAVDTAFARFAASSEGNKSRDSHLELKNSSSYALNGMLQAIVRAGDRPRTRGLHPVEHTQLSVMLASWRARCVLPPSPLEELEKGLEMLKPPPPPATGHAGEEAFGAVEKQNKRAAWIVVPPSSNACGPHATEPIGMSPTGPGAASTPAGRGLASSSSGPPTDDDRKASMEASLKELLVHNAKNADEWWGYAFEGRGPFREGPEGHWSMHLRRLRSGTPEWRKQGRGLLGVNGDHERSSGSSAWRGGAVPVDAWTKPSGKPGGVMDPVGFGGVDNGVKREDEDQDDGTPSSPSTVPSEASPCPERASPVPVTVAPVTPVAPAAPEVKEEATEVELPSAPHTEERSPSATKETPVGKGSEQPREDNDPICKAEPLLQPQQQQQLARSPPEGRALSKEEQEAEERQRRREDARRAGKERGKMRGREIEQQKRDKEMQRQRSIAEARQRKEAAARAERKAKEKAEAAAIAKDEEAVRRQRESEERTRRAKVLEARSTDEEGRRGRVKSRERERDRTREEQDGSRRDRDAEARGGRHGERAANSGRDIDGPRRDGRGGLPEKEERERGGRKKERDRAGGRDREDVRWHLDASDGSHDRPRGKGLEDTHQEGFEEWGRDGRRARGSSHRSAEEQDAADGRLKHNSKEREPDNADRKRRRKSKADQEAGEKRGERSEVDDRDHKANKKKSKKDRKEKKEKRREHRHSERDKAGSEEPRGHKRSRDFEGEDHDGAPPLDDDGSRPGVNSRDFAAMRDELPPRRPTDTNMHQRSSDSELGRSGNERKDATRQGSASGAGVGLSRHDVDGPSRGFGVGGSEDRRYARADGSEKRSRRNGGGDPPGGYARSTDTARERHTTRAANREPASFSAGRGGGLPGMDVYGAGISPPSGLELGGHGIKSGIGRGDHYRGSGSTSLDRYGPSANSGRDGSQEGRRRVDGSRPKLAAVAVYGQTLEEDARGGNRGERGDRERDHAPVDRPGREASGRRGDNASRQPGSSTFRRRSPERGQSSKREISGRFRPPSPTSYDGRDDSGGRSSGQARYGDGGPSSVRGGSGRTGPSGVVKGMLGGAGSDLGASVLEGSRAILHGSAAGDPPRDRPRQEDRDRPRQEGRDRPKMDDRERMRPGLDDADQTMADDRNRGRLDDRDRLRLDERDRLILDERLRPRQDGLERPILDDRDRPRLDDRDRPRQEGRGRQGLDDRERSRPDNREWPRLDDRDRPRLNNRDRPLVAGRDRPMMEDRNRQRLDDRDRQRLGDRDRPLLGDRNRLMLGDRDRPMLNDRDRDRLILNDRDRPMLNDRDRLMLNDRDRLMLNDRDRLMMIDRDRPMLNDRDRQRRNDGEGWRGRPQDWLGHPIDQRRGDLARRDRGLDGRVRGDSRERHDSREEEPIADADQPIEDEPEEGELVIEPSAPAPALKRTISNTKKSRWGDVPRTDLVLMRDGGVREGRRPSWDRARGASPWEEGGGQATREDGRNGQGDDTGERSFDDEDDEEEGEIGTAPQAKGGDGSRLAEEGESGSGGDGSEDMVVEDCTPDEALAQSPRDEGVASGAGVVKADAESCGSSKGVAGAADTGMASSATPRVERQDESCWVPKRTSVEASARSELGVRDSLSISRAEIEAAGVEGRESQERNSTAEEEKGEEGGIDVAHEETREVGAASAENRISAGVAAAAAKGDDSMCGEPGDPAAESRSGEEDTTVASGPPSEEKELEKQPGSGGAVEPSKRRSTGDPGNLAWFLRKNPPVVDEGADRHQSVSDSCSRSHPGAPVDDPEKDDSSTGNKSLAVPDATSATAAARAPRAPVGLAATWGSGRSTDTMSGWGGGNSAGAGAAAASGADGTSDAVGVMKKESGGKEETAARPGGAASRLMNAALQSSRDGGRRDKKGSDGGRPRGWRRGGYGSE